MFLNDFSLIDVNEEYPRRSSFEVKDLFEARPWMVFGYRQVWPHVRWRLCFQGEDLDVSKNDLVAELRDKWLNSLSKQKDNHQTFLVSICRGLYYVCFTDGYVLLGDWAREGD